MTLRDQFFLVLFFFPCIAGGQTFAPAAGEEGSTAIHMDSTVFRAWATGCDLERGPGIIMYPDSVEVTYGNAEDATGKADISGVVSLGDGGRATLTFDVDIRNGEGFDFAVFENAFDDRFLELAFVEVSSDGINYTRFPAISLTPADEQVGTFGTLDPGNIYNLAGKYRGGYGTPFDLEELKDIPGLDPDRVRFVRIIDVIGILGDSLGSKDANGSLINDPYPTPFYTGGFDLDAVGVIHCSFPSGDPGVPGSSARVYPNPFGSSLTVRRSSQATVSYTVICPGTGKTVARGQLSGNMQEIHLEMLEKGIYILRFGDMGDIHNIKIIKR